MKIRNTKKKTYVFYPHESSILKGRSYTYRFKNKKNLMRFLNGNFGDAVNGIVQISVSTLQSFYTERQYFVWYNEFEWRHNKTNKQKIVLKQELFRGRKYISKGFRTSKSDKKYFAFSDKVINLMTHIGNNGISESNAKNLICLFYKRGWKNEELTGDDIEYVEFYLKDNKEPQWFYWSDRCNSLRMKIIYEWFKKNNLI